MTSYEYKILRMCIVGFFILMAGVLAGVLIRPSGIHEPPPATVQTTARP